MSIMWVAALVVICLMTMRSNAEDSCPEVKIVGVGDSDKLTIIRGCPGLAGSPGQKGDVGLSGQNGVKGSVGQPGKVGPPGQKGEIGITGSPGQKGEKGDMGKSESLYVARNCKELLDQGHVLSDWYIIYPDGETPLKVLCDMHTDEGGWIVIQRRWDGSVDFIQDWKAYKTGFGSRLSEFWLGNDNLSKLTSAGTWDLRIDLQDFETTKHFAKYASFRVSGESEKYKLSIGALVGGNIGNSMETHNNMPFSTKDDDSSASKCVSLYKGGWWYNNCHNANLNGLYLQGKHDTYADGINWYNGKGLHYSYKYCEMKIRPAAGK